MKHRAINNFPKLGGPRFEPSQSNSRPNFTRISDYFPTIEINNVTTFYFDIFPVAILYKFTHHIAIKGT